MEDSDVDFSISFISERIVNHWREMSLQHMYKNVVEFFSPVKVIAQKERKYFPLKSIMY
jgi:hypothetical protein